MIVGGRNSDIPQNRPCVIQISLERNEMEASIKYISLSREYSQSNLFHNSLLVSLYGTIAQSHRHIVIASSINCN